MPRNEENLAILQDCNGGEVALKGVKVHGRLHGLMAEVEVEQKYINPQDTNIEAIYTFPLPLGATLLGLEVVIAGKKLAGSVVEKKKAERQYEDAITDGDSAIMLEEAGPGLYTVSLGNLMAGESAVIRYHYALLLSWQGNLLRFMIPTTIAPRYGNAEAAGMRPHQIPTASLMVDYPLDITIDVEGDLAGARFASPSHQIEVERSDNGMFVHLAGKACLDHDFILTLQSENAQSSCVITPDGEGQVALATLRIPPMTSENEKPLALKVVIDCSGSMGGTSIIQARKASLEILNLLKPSDSFNITLFGSSHEHFFKKMMPASTKNIAAAWSKLECLDANMGGTEMEKAIESAFSLKGEDEGLATVLLITDGEIHEHEKLVLRAKNSGHRIFTVGVGNAVAEVFLKSLSNITGGACELVAPQEGMTERVLMQFHRMRQPILGDIKVNWPAETEWQTAMPSTVFAGDTVQIFAGFKHPIEGVVMLDVQGATVVTTPITGVNETEIPRVAAAIRMRNAPDEDCLSLALKYQLLSRWTNFLVVAERIEKADDLPILHQVPQMLAAGWGGVGVMDVPSFCRSSSYDQLSMPTVMRTGRSSASVAAMKASGIAPLDIPSFLLKAEHTAYEADPTSARFIENLNTKYSRVFITPKQPETIDELVRNGLDEDVELKLRELVGRGFDEVEVVVSFLYALTQSEMGEMFSRSYSRIILKLWKQTIKNRAVDAEVRDMFAILGINVEIA